MKQSKQSEKNEKLLRIVRTGLLAAMICLLTALLHIPTPNGYIHCGDAVIYLAAATLPLPYAIAAAAVGGAMADFLSGYAVYILPTFLIKGVLAAAFQKVGGEEFVSRRKVAACVVCCLISVRPCTTTSIPGMRIQRKKSSGVRFLTTSNLKRRMKP